MFQSVPDDEQRRVRNRMVLMSFVNYCAENPDQRFWQALANWAKKHIFVASLDTEPARVFEAVEAAKLLLHDTREWTGRYRQCALDSSKYRRE